MKQGSAWPIGIAAILVVFVAANLVVMRLANNDPAFAIEPDYYNKAVAFDSEMSAERRSAALGWSASASIERGNSGPVLTVTLADARKQPIAGATVTIDARFNARANDVLTAALREGVPGQYAAPIAAGHAGQWEVRIRAVRGADRFLASTRVEVPVPR